MLNLKFSTNDKAYKIFPNRSKLNGINYFYHLLTNYAVASTNYEPIKIKEGRINQILDKDRE